jgi:hypothetical protein
MTPQLIKSIVSTLVFYPSKKIEDRGKGIINGSTMFEGTIISSTFIAISLEMRSFNLLIHDYAFLTINGFRGRSNNGEETEYELPFLIHDVGAIITGTYTVFAKGKPSPILYRPEEEVEDFITRYLLTRCK